MEVEDISPHSTNAPGKCEGMGGNQGYKEGEVLGGREESAQHGPGSCDKGGCRIVLREEQLGQGNPPPHLSKLLKRSSSSVLNHLSLGCESWGSPMNFHQ